MRWIAILLLPGCAFIVGPCSLEVGTTVCEAGGSMIIVPAPRPLRPLPSDGGGIIRAPQGVI